MIFSASCIYVLNQSYRLALSPVPVPVLPVLPVLYLLYLYLYLLFAVCRISIHLALEFVIASVP